MDFLITDDDRALQETIGRFSREVLMPAARDIDESAVFAGDRHFPALSELGVMGMNLPEEYGGAGVSPIAHYLAIEEISGACMSTASALTAHYMATDAILIGENEELKCRYLPKAATGQLLGAYAMTEPRGGSNPADMRVKAVKDGDAVEAIKKAIESLQESLHAWSKEAYEAAAAAQQQAAGPGDAADAEAEAEAGAASGAGDSDDDVVDAEFEKVDEEK